MKSIRYATLTSVLALGLAFAGGTAQADVEVFGTLDKDKDVFVLIDVEKFKDVDIDVDFDEDLVSAAESLAISNQVTTDNEVGPFGGQVEFNLLNADENFGIRLSALIQGSVNTNTGIVGVNQDVATANNQGNTVAVAALGPDSGASFTHAEASAEQINQNNDVQQIEQFEVDDPADLDPIADAQKRAEILNSFNENLGIITGNQSAGNMNNQTNNVALSVGIGSALALTEADLGQENSGNQIEEFETLKVSRIVNSVNNNSGVIAGNQTSGNMNNQGNVIAFSALTTSASIGVPGAGSP